ncbi:MAG TPA: NIPSNAP family protein [Dehalococcoidia bacterium]|nr:NIPSNAP family protein [Dehalococcoidia bacterium]
MIYEIRTYTIQAGTTADFEKLWGEAYPIRQKYSPIVGFFHTEFGPLNEVIHIWPYESLEQRARLRAEAEKEQGWPPASGKFIVNQRVEIVQPFPFAPEWKPGKDGPIYELRQYTFRAGTLPNIMKSWQDSLQERMKYSSPVLLGSVEFGPHANSFIHIWPYQSMEHRTEVRAKAAASGHWPPAGGRDYYLFQSNKLMLPASYSPAQ